MKNGDIEKFKNVYGYYSFDDVLKHINDKYDVIPNDIYDVFGGFLLNNTSGCGVSEVAMLATEILSKIFDDDLKDTIVSDLLMVVGNICLSRGLLGVSCAVGGELPESMELLGKVNEEYVQCRYEDIPEPMSFDDFLRDAGVKLCQKTTQK